MVCDNCQNVTTRKQRLQDLHHCLRSKDRVVFGASQSRQVVNKAHTPYREDFPSGQHLPDKYLVFSIMKGRRHTANSLQSTRTHLVPSHRTREREQSDIHFSTLHGGVNRSRSGP